MVELFVKWIVLSGVLLLAAAATPNIKVRSWGGALLASAVFGLANLLLGWLLYLLAGVLLFLPAVLTFGLVWVLIPIPVNMVLLKLADALSGGALDVRGLGPLFGLAVAVSITLAILSWF